MDEQMHDTSWVKGFLHNMFSGKSADAEKYMAEKMQYINKPFYKYCYVCEDSKRTAETIDYNIQNFENNELFFQDPSQFNDPFDCYLGFSQIQTIKELLLTAMRQKKKLTPNMRKAINLFFNEQQEEQITPDQLDSKTATTIMAAIVPLLLSADDSDEKTQLYIEEVTKELTKEENLPLLIKMLKHQLTIADKQKMIDILYANEAFLNYSKSELENPENSEWIISTVKHDMKLKVETTPDSVMFDMGSDTFQQFDFFSLIANMTAGQNISSELLEIKKQFNELRDSAMKTSRKIISDQCRVTCLSERMDSPLMWSHYANKHYGFCLEYDFTHTITSARDLNVAKIMLLPVIYSKKRPLLSNSVFSAQNLVKYVKTKKMPMVAMENIIYGLLFKSPDWAYEQEWRIIGLNMEGNVMKLPTPRKLFLGANIEKSTKEKLIEIARKKHIPVYQMFLSSDRYQFEYYKVE